jgi:hypothetical protein
MTKLKLLTLCSILCLGFILRIVDFGQNPPGLYVDEASLGYNSYSLLKTGKDEYGKSWPVFFRSFGTYPSALYGYLAVVPIKLFGLNSIAVRFPSLISGLILILLMITWMGPTVGLIIAISPVFVFMSRAAFEANLALTVFILALVLAIRSKVHRLFFPLSFVMFSLSEYAYHAERFLAPLFIVYFTFHYWIIGPKFKKNILLSLLLAIIIQVPLWGVSLSAGANLRLSELSYSGSLLQKSLTFSRLYLAYISPANLFSKPDPDLQRSFPDLSVFYWWLIIPFILGLYVVFRRRKHLSLSQKLLLILAAVSVVPGAVTKDYFSTLRVLPLFIPLSWIIAEGLNQLRRTRLPVYLIIIVFSLIDIYSGLVLLKHERSSTWDYEYSQLFSFLDTRNPLPMVIDNSRLAPVYILFAFYTKFPPSLLQSHYSAFWLANYYSHTDFSNDMTVGNLEFRPISWKDDVYVDQLLVADLWAISPSQQLEHHLKVVKEITDINGLVTFKVYQTNPRAKCKAAQTNHEPPHPACSVFLPASLML